MRSWVAVAALCCASAFAQEPGQEPIEWRLQNIAGVSPGEVRQFIELLQSAVQRSDKVAIAKLIDYPMTLRSPGQKDRKICNEQDFLANYPRIVTPQVADVIREQRFEDLFANWQGVMFGAGELWMSGICLDKKCDRHLLKVVAVGNLRNYDARISDR